MRLKSSDNEFEVATALTFAITLLATIGFVVAIWQLFVLLFGN
jgi:hypothetical protein